MQRPSGVTATAILMGLNICFDIIHPFLSRSMLVTPAHPLPPNFNLIIHIVLVTFILIQIGSVIFYLLGRAWARWMILAGCIYYLIGLKDVPFEWHRSLAVTIVTTASGLLSLFLLWYLHTRTVREWFGRNGSAQA